MRDPTFRIRRSARMWTIKGSFCRSETKRGLSRARQSCSSGDPTDSQESESVWRAFHLRCYFPPYPSVPHPEQAAPPSIVVVVHILVTQRNRRQARCGGRAGRIAARMVHCGGLTASGAAGRRAARAKRSPSNWGRLTPAAPPPRLLGKPRFDAGRIRQTRAEHRRPTCCKGRPNWNGATPSSEVDRTEGS
jgi:hypothetical protein